jgi:hypothetical protein
MPVSGIRLFYQGHLNVFIMRSRTKLQNNERVEGGRDCQVEVIGVCSSAGSCSKDQNRMKQKLDEAKAGFRVVLPDPHNKHGCGAQKS